MTDAVQITLPLDTGRRLVRGEAFAFELEPPAGFVVDDECGALIVARGCRRHFLITSIAVRGTFEKSRWEIRILNVDRKRRRFMGALLGALR